jgi:hypothetical protein
MTHSSPLALLLLTSLVGTSPLLAADAHTLHTFSRQRLTDVYYSEGANAGDVNGDGQPDVVYGPHWYAGPDFKTAGEIYPPKPQNTDGYADNFFNWVHDFNGDNRADVLVVGFPGTPAYVYENPGPDGLNSHWKKHYVCDWVSNESPQFTNLVGDERPELVCTRDGYFGYYAVNWDAPFAAWAFHPVSEKVTAPKFGHGLGIGDINGDGRADVIHSQGWLEQPAADAEDSLWAAHKTSFSGAYGGAEMYAYDVDGDGDSDVITSEAAHDYGLAWYEQQRDGDEAKFVRHLIMGMHPSENRYGVLFTEPHSVNLADIDGDGLKDIVTGKTYWSHHKQSPLWDAGAVVYWFKLARSTDGVDWLPYQADGEAGIGRQLTVTDINADGQPDIVVGGMLGAHVLTHQVRKVSRSEWEAAQPQRYAGEKISADGAKAVRGPQAPLDEASKAVPDALEGESLTATASGGATGAQSMGGFQEGRWSGGSHLFWTGAGLGDKLTIALPEFTGPVDVEAVLTCAPDYAIVRLSLDDQALGTPIDLYDKKVVPTGVLSFRKVAAGNGTHTLTVQIVGANSRAKPALYVGLDYLRIKLPDGAYIQAPLPTK